MLTINPGNKSSYYRLGARLVAVHPSRAAASAYKLEFVRTMRRHLSASLIFLAPLAAVPSVSAQTQWRSGNGAPINSPDDSTQRGVGQPAGSPDACPGPLRSPGLAQIADRISRRLAGQVGSFDANSALALVSRDMNSYARLELPSAEYGASRDRLARLDPGTVAACWPRLGATLAGARESVLAAASQPAPSSTAQRYGERQVEQAERRRANAEAAQAHATELQTRADKFDARVDARQRAERDERELQEQADKSAAIRRSEQERERRAEIARQVLMSDQRRLAGIEQKKADERTKAEEEARQSEVEDAKRNAEQARRAETYRAEQEVRAKAAAEHDARVLAEQRERAPAERAREQQYAVRRAAERLERPQCREADRIFSEEVASLEGAGITSAAAMKDDWLNFSLEFALTYYERSQAEICSAAAKLFTSSERMRSVAGRCQPAETAPFDQLSSHFRGVLLKQGC